MTDTGRPRARQAGCSRATAAKRVTRSNPHETKVLAEFIDLQQIDARFMARLRLRYRCQQQGKGPIRPITVDSSFRRPSGVRLRARRKSTCRLR
jgi:hypothetical protein